jgi:hypothetical protein
MKENATRVVRFSAGLAGVLVVAWVLVGQAAKPVLEGLPTDWTHRHVIFSQPTTAEQAQRLAQDPRYWQQWYRQNFAREASPELESVLSNVFHKADSSSSLQRDWSEDLGSTGTVGAGNFPAKYSFSITNANCGNAAKPDFVVFSTGLAGSGTQASIVAFDNLYSGCTAPVPAVYWAYNTGGQILTSPVFSGDGSQVAFVQTNGLTASLVLLRWAASTTETVIHPGAPTSLAPTSYFGCTAPCMTTIALTTGGGTPTGTNDTTSSVYYDYTGDTAWVGDGSGWLHQFTPVFIATPTETSPAEVRNTTWPVQVNTTTPTALTSPVHDLASGNVFVGDKGGFLYSVSASNGTVAASAQVDHGVGLASGPILDSTSGYVYVFSSSDGSTNCPGPAACSAVYQFATNFTGGATGTEVTVGTSSATPNPLYDGAFDYAYLTSPGPPTGPTGNLYVCGDTGVNPILYRVPITKGVFGNAVSVAQLTAAADLRACSPVTDLLNPNATGGAEERVFFSVTDNGHPTACGGAGCAMSFISSPWQALTAYQVGQEILVYRPANNTLKINVAIVATGPTGGTVPTWPNAAGTVTHDGGVQWLNQGTAQVTAMNGWVAGHGYAVSDRIFDGKNVEVVTAVGTSGGTSGATAPTWATTAGGTTLDGTPPTQITWTNAGFLPSAALKAAGGTSGFIVDNTAASAGASQVYFSTLSNQACPTTSGGCAVQASQSALQ